MQNNFSNYPNSNELAQIITKNLETELKNKNLYSAEKNDPQTYELSVIFNDYKRVSSFFKGDAFAFFIFSEKISVLKNGEEIASNECRECKITSYTKDFSHGFKVLFSTGSQKDELEDLEILAEINTRGLEGSRQKKD
jgi:hypothetical protein